MFRLGRVVVREEKVIGPAKGVSDGASTLARDRMSSASSEGGQAKGSGVGVTTAGVGSGDGFHGHG